MPTQSQDTQTNGKSETPQNEESSQARTGTEVREGQEDSSILHDEHDETKELNGPIHKDDRALSQQEYIEDRNTSKKEPEDEI